VLLVLLAAEGVTILRIRALLTPHVFIGMLLIPPVLLKMGSTTWRFARYYLGSPEYQRKGPPPMLLRLLGPIVVVLTVSVFATGIVLLLGPTGWRSQMLLLHKASFILWLAVMAFHVLGHVIDTARLAPRDWYRRTRRQVRGAGLRQWAIATSLALGLVLGLLVVPRVGPWLASGHPGHL
jgi:cytochrome c biogenesis protein CcdA